MKHFTRQQVRLLPTTAIFVYHYGGNQNLSKSFMPSPFPGMDPYLEQPAFWSSFHSRLIVAIADVVAPYIRPKYYIEVETRTYLDDADDGILVRIPNAVVLSSTLDRELLPSVETLVAVETRPQKVRLPMVTEVRERYLEVRESGTDAVVTVMEILSPKNKRKGKGRVIYEQKRRTILQSASHLIEIDLLRGDEPMPMIDEDPVMDYRLLVSRSEQRPFADLYGFSLRAAIPTFPLPLKAEDAEPNINLQQIFTDLYERAGYDYRLDYRQAPPLPNLSPDDQQWLNTGISTD